MILSAVVVSRIVMVTTWPSAVQNCSVLVPTQPTRSKPKGKHESITFCIKEMNPCWSFTTPGISARRCPSVVKETVGFSGIIQNLTIMHIIYSILKHYIFWYNYILFLFTYGFNWQWYQPYKLHDVKCRDGWWVNWRRDGRKPQWYNLTYCPEIYADKRSKTMTKTK